MKQCVYGVVALVCVLGVGMPISFVHAEFMDNNIVTTIAPASIEEQEMLEAIAVQLQEIENAVNRLSLEVHVYVLEKQAFALQQRLEGTVIPPLANAQQNGAPIDRTEVFEQKVVQDTQVATAGSVSEEQTTSDASSGNLALGEQFEGSLEDVSGPIVLDISQENSSLSFVASLRENVARLGTPERVTLGILIALTVLIIVRRMRRQTKKIRVQEPVIETPETSQIPLGRLTLEGSGQDFKNL